MHWAISTQQHLVFLTVLVLASSSGVNCQHTTFGSCPDFPVVVNFSVEKYLGRWYEYSKYETSFQKGSECSIAEYSYQESTEGVVQIGVNNTSVKYGGAPSSALGVAVLGEPDNPAQPGKLIVNFDSQPFFTRSTSTNYNVLDTDYHGFAIVYSCTSRFVFFKKEFLWILTRSQQPPTSLIDQTVATIEGAGIDTTRLVPTRQDICPWSSQL